MQKNPCLFLSGKQKIKLDQPAIRHADPAYFFTGSLGK